MNLKIFKTKFYPVILVIILLSLFLLLPKTTDKQAGKVKYVIDGDTIELYDGRVVRYIAVDTPAIKQQQGGKWIFSPEPFSIEARDFNDNLVLGKQIRLEFDLQEKDRYGRVLAYCFLKTKDKEIFINQKILEEGLGYVTITLPNVKYFESFIQAQRQAQHEQKGLWRQQKAISPKEANKYIGEKKIVEGKVVDVAQTRRSIVLKFHKRKHSYLKLVIFKNYLNNFLKLNIDPKTYYLKKEIRVFGVINEYSGPEMAVFHPLEIEILE